MLKTSSFFLIVHADRPVGELMNECAACGAMTSYCLELAWRIRSVTCSECLHPTRLNECDLTKLRFHLDQACLRIDRLM